MSEKTTGIPDNNKAEMESVSNKIESRIRKSGRGKFVFASQFAAFASQDAAVKTLQRLMASGTLIRISRGVYYYPRIDTRYGLGIIQPTLGEIALAIAARDRVKVFPTGAYALHALGLSDQVPANAVFITNGSDRQLDVCRGRMIQFRHSDNARNFAYRSPQMQLIVSALKEIGEGKATDSELQRIREVLVVIPAQSFAHDVTLAPAWIREILLSL